MSAAVSIKSSAVRTEFAAIMERVMTHKHRLVVTHYGEPAVVVIPIEDLQRLEARLKGSYNIPD